MKAAPAGAVFFLSPAAPLAPVLESTRILPWWKIPEHRIITRTLYALNTLQKSLGHPAAAALFTHHLLDPEHPGAGSAPARHRAAGARRPRQVGHPTASQQADQKFLTDTLSLLDSIDKEKSKAKTQSERLRTLPAELKEIGAKLDALTQGKSPEQLKNEYATMSLAELDARQPEIMANMQAAQEALGTIGSQITNLQTLPERAQASMSRAYQRSQEIRTRLNAGDGVSSAEKMKLNAELALLDLQLANLQKELDNRTSMQDLVVKQRDYQSARLASEEQKLQALQEQSSAKRLGTPKRPPKRPANW